jgi:hypothetical protein
MFLSDLLPRSITALAYGHPGAFAVDRVSPIIWNKYAHHLTPSPNHITDITSTRSTIFSSLVLDQHLKDTIYRLVVAHSTESSHFDDFVKGKGKGLIGLFFGPPGAGKTLTGTKIPPFLLPQTSH